MKTEIAVDRTREIQMNLVTRKQNFRDVNNENEQEAQRVALQHQLRALFLKGKTTQIVTLILNKNAVRKSKENQSGVESV